MADEMHGGMTPFESFMVMEKTSRRPSRAAVTGLVLGGIATALGVGSWIFGPMYAASRSKGIEGLVAANNRSLENNLDHLAGLLAAERNERVAQGTTISQTITDTISGQQQGSQSQSTSVEASAMAQATTQLLTQSLLGNLSENAQKVQIYSAPKPCDCPGCGCGA